MNGMLIRWLVSTISIIITAYLISGIHSGFFSALFAAALLGFLNAFFRPVVLLLTLPINLLSLGLFTFVINALLLMMVSGVIPGFSVDGFWWALLGSLIISLVSWLLNSLINERGHVQHIDFKRLKQKRRF
jgi:putative membrane protein